MFDVFIKSLTFIIIICIGFGLKKLKVLKKKDADVLATIIMNVTLPCALLTSANGISVDSTIIILLICGILTNSFMPCNGRFPFLITIAMIFIGSYFTGVFSSITEPSKLLPSKICSANFTLPVGLSWGSVIPLMPGVTMAEVVAAGLFSTSPEVA